MEKTEKTIEQRLSALHKLQSIDTKLDEIKKMRGALPDEVRDLEDEIAKFETRISKFQGEVKEFEQEIENRKQRKKEAEKLITKYKDQQMKVRNDREFQAIAKEIESEELEIQLSEKRIKEATDKIQRKKTDIENVNLQMDDLRKVLANKQVELKALFEESEEEEAKLLKERDKQTKNIEERLLRSYDRLRGNANNGLAVVMVKRDACGGCFHVVPPQRQVEIKEKKKIIVCEHCGRIFAGVEEVNIPVPEPKKATRKIGVKSKEEAEGETL
jgi:predicted  nucleic acid-binding Zn-ribbon protein